MSIFVCPPPPSKGLDPATTVLGVGFGSVTVRRNRTIVWTDDSDETTLEGFEIAAQIDKGNGKWSVQFEGPLSGSTYVRDNQTGEWLLTKTTQGFA